jgi:hypothetical protein
MNTPIKIKTTQYGLSARAGGWDPDGDSGTDNWKGNHGNTLNICSCALTVSAEEQLALSRGGGARQLPPGALLKITWPDSRLVLYRTFDDRAPEADPRIDLFMPWAFDHHLPDFGNVEVVE